MNLKGLFSGDKLIIQMFYWIVILVIICIHLSTVQGYSNEVLAGQISFGATLSGIILSFIAIIITLIGETKSDNTKDTLIGLSKELEKIVENVKESTTKLEEVSVDKERLETLSKKVDEVAESWESKGSYNKVTNSKNQEACYITILKKYIEGLGKKGDTVKYVYGIYWYIIQKNMRNEELNYETTKKFFEKFGLDEFHYFNRAWYGSMIFAYPIEMHENNMDFINEIEENLEKKYPEMKKAIEENLNNNKE